MFRGKKNKVGIQTKPRARQEVDKDYQNHAIQAGHKSRMILEHHAIAEKLEGEVKLHLAKMQNLDLEFQAAKAPEAPTPPPSTAVENAEPTA